MDDILVYGDTPEQHDQHLSKVLERIESAGLILTKSGQSVSSHLKELKQVLGMFNYLGRYIPNLSTVVLPLYNLLQSQTARTWDHSQQEAFQHIKDILSTSPVLNFYVN